MRRPRWPTRSTRILRRQRPINLSRRFLVFGKVQGVYFRHATRLVASRLGICGSARNLPDGSVEVIAYGPPGALEALETWLHEGPEQARVDEVRVFESDEAAMPQKPTEFTVL
jgi:acylphosphatase